MSRRTSLLALFVLWAALFWPCLVRGWVVYPHDNAVELGVHTSERDPYPSNRKFSDTSSFYVPEVHEHLNGDHEAWLATWAPHVELGRPLGQFSGFSPAFLVTRVLAWTTSDAFVLLTRLTLLTVLLAGLFALEFLAELGLKREAAFAAAALLVLGPYSMYWLTCVLFVSGWCWTFLISWMVASHTRAPAAWKGLCIAFGAHALLATGYPQQIVWHLYALVPFTLARCWTSDPTRRVRTFASVVAWALLGVALSAPIYADLVLATLRSSRGDVDAKFFLPTLNGVNGTGEPWLFLAQLFDAFWIGDPMSELRAFSGVTLTPVLVAGIAVGLASPALRRAWGWLILVALGIAMAFSEELYLFGVRHLGLSFSRYAPMAGALIPATVVAAYGFDAALRKERRAAWSVLVVAVVPLAIALVRFTRADVTIEPAWLACGVVLYALALFALLRAHALLLCALAAAGVIAWGRPEILARPRESIATSSMIVDRARELLPNGARYVGAGDVVSRLLPPNQESLIGVSSVHSFNSLSSKLYQDWVLRISEVGTRTYGRQFRKITGPARLDRDELARAGVGAVVAEMPLESELLEERGVLGPAHFYATRTAPLLEARIDEFEPRKSGGFRGKTPLASVDRSLVRRERSSDDHLRFTLAPSERQTLLFVSQQYHPQWTAKSGERELTPLLVDGFYQGVLVPPNTTSVELVFRPWALWAWIPQLVFVALALVCALIARSRANAAPRAFADRS